MELDINGEPQDLGDLDPSTPLLWALRDTLGLVGTKYGCGANQCSACMVLIDGRPQQSCRLPIQAVADRRITTIEGIAAPDGSLHPVQQVWIDEDVAQCGYCQAGQIVSAVALLDRNPRPDDAEIDAAMSANLCRCGTYTRIRKAVHAAADRIARKEAKA